MIYVECKPDLALLRSVTTIPRREIVHEFKGKYEICRLLEKNRNGKALVDEDPQAIQPGYIVRIQKGQQKDDSPQHHSRVLYDASNNNHLVLLCPRLEEWVLAAAREADQDVRRYRLPDNAAALHREINLRLDNFQRLLDDLKGSNRLKTLSRLLQS